MATLTQTAFAAKKLTKLTLTLSAAGLTIFIFYLVGKAVITRLRPPPPPPPTAGFGKIARLELDLPIATSSASFTYDIQTVGESLGKFGPLGFTFGVTKPVAGLLSFERAKRKAANLGFTGEPIKLSDTYFQWNSAPAPLPRTLKYDMVTEDLELETNYRQDPEIRSRHPESVEKSIQKAKDFLGEFRLIPDDVKEENITFQYLKLEEIEKKGQKIIQLAQAISLQDANFVGVNFFRNKLDGKPLLSENPDRANIWVLVSGAEGEKRIAHVIYSALRIEHNKFETYPLKSAKKAFEELKGGKSFVLKSPPPGQKIIIRNIYLGYVEPKKYTPVIQPVVVYEGDGPFMAVVPAVVDEWTQAP